MHHMRCRCTRALVASCTRTSPAQPARAAVVFSTRAISSSSTLFAFRRDADKSKLRKAKEFNAKVLEAKAQLDEEAAFFSRALVQQAESSTSSQKGDRLLNLCDQAIVLSRSSSNPETYDRVKDLLVTAAGVFNAKLQHVKAEQVEDVDLSYDVFLLRSSWLQVVRTLQALVGREAIEVCTSMMCDYLEWEATLCTSGFKFKDGTEELPSAQAKQQGNGKMQEERFFHGPFLQDSAIIVYDLFWQLTVSTADLVSDPGGAKYLRSYTDLSGPRRSAIASRLWEKVAAIPCDAWKKPITAPWRPHTIDDEKEAINAQQLVGASMAMHGQALLRSIRVVECVNLWKDAIPICADGAEDYRAAMLDKIWVLLERTARQLRHGDVAHRHAVCSPEDYFTTLYLLLNMLVTHQWPQSKSKSDISSHEQLLEHVVLANYTEEMIVERGARQGSGAEVSKLVKRIDAVLQSYMINWSDASTQWYRPPPIRSLKLCNSILYRLITGGKNEQPAPEAALKFLQLMADSSTDLPAPNRTTSTRLLRAAREAGDSKVFHAVVQALRGEAMRSLIRVREEGSQDTRSYSSGSTNAEAVSSPPPSTPPGVLIKSNFLLLAEEAMRHGDTERMVTLLKSLTKRSRLRQAALPQFSDATPDQIVFLLYPTLNIESKRSIKRQVKASVNSAGRTEAMNKVTYNPNVLVLVLQLAVDKGRTGLSERIWRLIKRASKPKDGKSGPIPGWPIPIRAYTLMMRLYAKEIQRSAAFSGRLVQSRRRGLQNSTSGGPEVRGWGRVLDGPLQSRLPAGVRLGRDSTARTLVKQEYQELRERWANGTAEPADDFFWMAIDRVFRRKAGPGLSLQLDNDEDVTFYDGMMQDKAAASPSPAPAP